MITGNETTAEAELGTVQRHSVAHLGIIAFFSSVGFLASSVGFLLKNLDHFVLAPTSTSTSSDNVSNAGLDQSRRSLGRSSYFDFDPKTLTPRAPADTVPLGALPPNNHNSTLNGHGEICIAAVEDGMITASAVVDDVTTSYMALALPDNYETDVRTECMHFNEQKGREEITRAFSSKVQYRQLIACDRKVFQPGYYDHSTGFWHDTCTGSQPIQPDVIMMEKKGLPALLTAESCPALSSIENDIWVSFIGDSVTRQYFYHGVSDKEVNTWSTGRNNLPDWSLFAVGGLQSRKIWFSHTFDFISVIEGGESYQGWNVFEKPFTWGDFVRLREAGPRDDDPQFPFDKMPDIVFYSGGYHASFLTSSRYGAAVEEALIQYHDASKAHNVPMPQFHLLLNIMPATYLIPRKYSTDRQYRTMLNEYHKNLAVIAVARKYDFVKSVLDAFSIELTFHDNTRLVRYAGPFSHGIPVTSKEMMASYYKQRQDVHRDAGEFLTMVIVSKGITFWR